jgi:hypothetical protein
LDSGLVSENGKGPNAKFWDLQGFPELFSHWKCDGQGSRACGPWRRGRTTSPPWTEPVYPFGDLILAFEF